ncbi:MAG: hypothetical protein WAM11_10040 [Cyanobium sp.]
MKSMQSISDLASSGFVYVANTPAYVLEAQSSMFSLRLHNPAVKVALVAPENLWPQAQGFDVYVELDLDDRTPIVKLDARKAPFDRVCFLDTDTRVTGDMSEAFALLDRFDLCLAHEPTRGWDYGISVPPAFCELNTGVIFFRKTAKVLSFFDTWLAWYRAVLSEQGLRNDQPAFRRALWETEDIDVWVLPSEFHSIVGKPVAIAWEARLLHGRVNLARVEQLINAKMGCRTYVPGVGCLSAFDGRKGLLRDWLRLTIRYFVLLIRQNDSPEMGTKQAVPHRWHLGETE